MIFTVVDTESAYRRLLDAPDAAAREAIFRAELVAPFEGLVQAFGGGDALAMFKQWGMSPEQFAEDNHARMAATLDTLAGYDAWSKAIQALEEGRAAFAAYADRISLERIVFGLYLADLSATEPKQAYTGFGGMPGYIMTVYGTPNDYTLHRLKGATVHELHHNIWGTQHPFNPFSTTVGEYMIMEGLAESFAAELYGEDVVGFYVTDFDQSRFEDTRAIVGAGLDVTGFDRIRGYIFGDEIAEPFGLEKVGVPAFAGYALGYHTVQAYLQRTGKTVVEATFVTPQEIIVESGYFA